MQWSESEGRWLVDLDLGSGVHQEGMLLEVEYDTVHRSKKENFIVEGNEKANEVGKFCSIMDGGGVEQNRTSTL